MKEIYASIINDRIAEFPVEHRANDYNEDVFKDLFDYHVTKIVRKEEEGMSGLKSLYILVTSDNDIVCTGTISMIKECLKLKNIPTNKVFNLHNHMND